MAHFRKREGGKKGRIIPEKEKRGEPQEGEKNSRDFQVKKNTHTFQSQSLSKNEKKKANLLKGDQGSAATEGGQLFLHEERGSFNIGGWPRSTLKEKKLLGKKKGWTQHSFKGRN